MAASIPAPCSRAAADRRIDRIVEARGIVPRAFSRRKHLCLDRWREAGRQEVGFPNAASWQGADVPGHVASLLVGANDADIVWAWHLWDQLIQGAGPAKDNFGVVGDHPEQVDINLTGARNGTWDHANAIEYNETFDQIVIRCRKLGEFLVIDHSTEGDRYDYAVHSALWIPIGHTGAGIDSLALLRAVDGASSDASPAGAGTYLVRSNSPGFAEARRVTLTK